MVVDCLIKYLFVFGFCASSGYFLEVVFRSLNNHKLTNPGFLNGFCLPIYGCGGIVLFVISSLLKNIENIFFQLILVYLIGMIIMTLIELIGGLFILHKYNMMLWDYSNSRINYKGLICLKYSLAWGLISVFYFYVLYPFISKITIDIPNINGFILLIGIYYGIFFCDLNQSMHLAENIKQFGKEISETIKFERLKSIAKDHLLLKKSPKVLDYLPINYMKEYLNDKRNQASLRINKAKDKIEDIKEDYEDFKEALKEMLKNEKDRFTK